MPSRVPESALRRGDEVWIPGHSFTGIVLRVAKDGSWADVDWGAWSKRQRKPSLLKKVLHA